MAIFGFPKIYLRKQPTFTSEKISLLLPKLRALKYLYLAPLVICPTPLLVLLIAAADPLDKPSFNETFLFFPVILFLGFYDGLFALITGVFPMPKRRQGLRFVADPEHAYRRLAQMQILLAILGTLVTLAVFLFYSG
jgi:hypothetical protein